MKIINGIVVKIIKSIKNYADVFLFTEELGLITIRIYSFNSSKNESAAVFRVTNQVKLKIDININKYGKELFYYKLIDIISSNEDKNLLKSYFHYEFLLKIYKILFTLKNDISEKMEYYYIYNLVLKLQNNLISFKKNILWLVECYIYYYISYSIGISIPILQDCNSTTLEKMIINFKTMKINSLNSPNIDETEDLFLKNVQIIISKKTIDTLNDFRYLKYTDLNRYYIKKVDKENKELKTFFERYFAFQLNKVII